MELLQRQVFCREIFIFLKKYSAEILNLCFAAVPDSGVAGSLPSGFLGFLPLSCCTEGPLNCKGLVFSQVGGPLSSQEVSAAQSRHTPLPSAARLQTFNRTEMV